MGVYQYITGAVSCSNATEFTGSFCRITALGANDAEVELSRVEFGILADPESDTVITSVAGKIILPAGASIEGPIARFKTGTNAANEGFIAYKFKG